MLLTRMMLAFRFAFFGLLFTLKGIKVNLSVWRHSCAVSLVIDFLPGEGPSLRFGTAILNKHKNKGIRHSLLI